MYQAIYPQLSYFKTISCIANALEGLLLLYQKCLPLM